MPIKKAKVNEKVLKPVRPNAGIGAAYRRKLDALVLNMHESIVYWVKASYKKQSAHIAMDGDPANELQATMNELTRQWLGNFNEGGDKIADWFMNSTKNYADGTLAAILREVGMSVQFKMTRAMRTDYNAVRNEQVGLIRSIAQRHLSDVGGLVMRSVQQGRNLGELAAELEARYGITKRRAALIARDQNQKATSTLNRSRQKELGITEAIWKHSHAGKEPRPSHLAADGKRYNLEKGMFLDGEWTQVGLQINCRCTSQPIIKGFTM
jgi:SPP1 gp7 family putative phage head morphogenesis protein